MIHIASVLALLAILAVTALTGCSTKLPPIKARACRILHDGTQICVGTDGKSITLDLLAK